ncbi:NADH-quinone oxidoreductase subunit NuoK [Elusimicrobiota bacterium]
MNIDINQTFKLFVYFIPLLLVIGIYCIVATRNLIRTLIGIEILAKAITLLVILVGYITNNLALAQEMIITFIVVEVVLMVAAAGVVINIFNKTKSLDVRNIRELKG